MTMLMSHQQYKIEDQIVYKGEDADKKYILSEDNAHGSISINIHRLRPQSNNSLYTHYDGCIRDTIIILY